MFLGGDSDVGAERRNQTSLSYANTPVGTALADLPRQILFPRRSLAHPVPVEHSLYDRLSRHVTGEATNIPRHQQSQ